MTRETFSEILWSRCTVEFFMSGFQVCLPLSLATLLTSIVFGFVDPCLAQSAAETATTAASKKMRMPPVHVVASPLNTRGVTTLESETLKRLPASNRLLPDAVRTVPRVQFEDRYGLASEPDELLPASYSISGGRYYQNNIQLNNLSNNNLIDPTLDRIPVGDPNYPQGHPNNLFVPTSLLGKVQVYTHQVPAQFGSFTGGMVRSEIRDPRDRLSVTLTGRTTHSDWSHSLSDRSGATELETPSFHHYNGGLQIDIPFNQEWAGLFAVGRHFAQSKADRLGEEKTYTKNADHALFKIVGTPGLLTRVALTGVYSPYQAETYLQNSIRSDFDQSIKGQSLALDVEHRVPGVGLWSFTLGGAQTKTSRQAPNKSYIWWKTESIDWVDSGFGLEGGAGDVEIVQQDLTFKPRFETESFKALGGRHTVISGVDFEYTRGRLVQNDPRFQYFSLPFNVGDIDCNGADGCIEGEQYAFQRTIFPAYRASAKVVSLAYYLEDTVEIQRLQLTPGVRFSYDDLMENLHAAPRFSAVWDLMGDGNTKLTAGANRYYGKSFLSYALKEKRPQFVRQNRSLNGQTPDAWGDSSGGTSRRERFSRLETPYSDELSVGVEQKVLGGIFSLTGVYRDNRDEFAREDVDGATGDFYELNNRGRSRYRSISGSYRKSWGRHRVECSLTWQRRLSNAEDLDASFDADDLASEVVYRGKVIPQWELPPKEFNKEWLGTLLYAVDLPHGFDFTNFMRYTGPYDLYTRVGTDAQGRAVYEDDSRGSELLFDWKLRWQKEWPNHRVFSLSADILNVFNRKVPVGSDGETKMGRQFWVEAQYQF